MKENLLVSPAHCSERERVIVARVAYVRSTDSESYLLKNNGNFCDTTIKLITLRASYHDQLKI
jgi:hypothetical protein